MHKSKIGADCLIKIFLTLFSLVVIFFLRKHSFLEPLELDESSYMMIAKVWQDGGKPYIDLWDNKPLGNFFIYRLGIAIFGYEALTVRWLSMAAMLLTTALWSIFLWNGQLRSFIIGIILWPFFTVLVDCQVNGANSEVFLLPFIVGLLICLKEYIRKQKEIFWYGGVIIFVLSVLIKQVMLPYGLLFFAVLKKEQILSIPQIIFRAGFLLTLFLLSHIVFYTLADLPPFYFLEQYVESMESISPLVKGENTFLRFLSVFFLFPVSNSIVAILPVTLTALIGLAISLFKKEENWIILISLYVVTLAAIALPRSNFNHYYILLLPVILYSLVLFFSFLKNRLVMVMTCTAAIIFFMDLTLKDYLNKTPYEISEKKYGIWFLYDRQLGNYLRERGLTGKKMFVDGAHSGVYFYSKNFPSTPFYVNLPYLYLNKIKPEEVLSQLKANPPEYIVLIHNGANLPGLHKWLQERYHPGLSILKSNVKFFLLNVQELREEYERLTLIPL